MYIVLRGSQSVLQGNLKKFNVFILRGNEFPLELLPATLL